VQFQCYGIAYKKIEAQESIGVDIRSNMQLFFGEQPVNLLTALSVKGMKLSSVVDYDIFL